MSSTDSQQAAFAAFFDKLSKAATSSGASYFPTGSDAQLASYYVQRSDAGNHVSDFEPARFEQILRARWAANPELLDLIPDLAALYKGATLDDRDERGDVSPFIYEMF